MSATPSTTITDPLRPNYYEGYLKEVDNLTATLSMLGPQEHRGFLKGNVLKYLWRYAKKNGQEDLQKAKVYLDFLVEFEKFEEYKPE